jgi:integrase
MRRARWRCGSSRSWFATPLLRSMIITALDSGTRQDEMLALRFADIDEKRQLIVLRGETTKSKKTRMVPISTCG